MSKDPTIQRESPPIDGLEATGLPLPPDSATTGDVVTEAESLCSDRDSLESDSDPESDEDWSGRETSAQFAPEAGAKASLRSLPSRNIVIDGKRTSVRLDAYSLEALYDAADREHCSVNELCTMIQERGKLCGYTLTAAIRIYLLAYFRGAATEEGHRLAEHGRSHPLAGTPFDPTLSAEAVLRAYSAPRRRTRTPSASGNSRGRSRQAAERPAAEDAVAG